MVRINRLPIVVRYFWVALFILMLSPATYAKTVFEGYYKILIGGVHGGYVVQRYEFEPKTKVFTSTYYIRTNALGGNAIESLKAKANHKFQPISYQYTAQVNKTLKTIDANFKNSVMTATVSDGKSSNTITKKFPKGSFLSTFLGYLMLNNGYKKGKKFTYSAIAEEDADAYSGESFIKSESKHRGHEAYRILNSFKGSKFISLVSPKGEVLHTTSPVQQISTELVSSPAEATRGMSVNSKSLRVLFGRVPLGKTNVLAAKPKLPVPATKGQPPEPKGK